MSNTFARLIVPWLCALSVCRPGSASESPGAYEVQRGPRFSAETTFTGMRGRYADYRIRISNDRRLSVTGRLLQPTNAAVPRRYPAVLLQNGRELNSRAVEFLPADFGDVVVLSLDYPNEFPYELSMREILLRSDRLRRAARRVAPMFSLGADYLLARADVDTSRLVIVATSFAVPFAVQAAAADTRFVNVGLVYGAGNMAEVLEANLTFRPRWMRPAVAWLAVRPFAEFAPERHVSRISPRPIVMVNGIDDPQMPRHAVQTLYDEAREPKTIIWLRTGHLLPEDSALVRALVDTTLARLPALRDVAATRRQQRLFEPLHDDFRLFVQHHLTELFLEHACLVLSAFAAEKRFLPSLTQRSLLKRELGGAAGHGKKHYVVPLPCHVVERDDFATDLLVDGPEMLVDDLASFGGHARLEFQVAHGVPRHPFDRVSRLRPLAEPGARRESEK